MIRFLERPLRNVARVIALAAVVAAVPAGAQAQDYPSQDIRFICGFPAGSGADVLVRYFGEKVRQVANRTIIVENKVGAAGNIAAVYTARSKADGHTIYVHAAKEWSRRGAVYSDSVALTEDGGIVSYDPTLPVPLEVRAIYGSYILDVAIG